MTEKLSIVLAQCQFTPADVNANLFVIEQQLALAAQQQADLVVFPQLALSAPALQDAWLETQLRNDCQQAEQRLLELAQQHSFILGLPQWDGEHLYNSCTLFTAGSKQGSYSQQHLAVGSELQRHFTSATASSNIPCFEFAGYQIGLALDNELTEAAQRQQLAALQPDLILNLAADTFYPELLEQRESNLASAAQQLGCTTLLVNNVGGQGELVFAGASCVVNNHGKIVARAPALQAQQLVIELPADKSQPLPVTEQLAELPSTEAGLYQALQIALRDYTRACGFNGALLGLSGGIDSALALAIAADALGGEQVSAIMLPYHYTAAISQQDAAEQAQRLGVNYQEVPIAAMVDSFQQALTPSFAQLPASANDTSEQNLQARCRGTLLMGIANRSGALLITNSNKSEMAVGYCTLYGDMAGGFALLKDIPKTMVYRLARYRNSISPVIPERVIERPPTAELAPDQEDTDNLPSYDILDEILRLYVEENHSKQQIIAAGLPVAAVEQVTRLIQLNEFKRRQAAPGPRLSKRGFGQERQMPLVKKLF